METMKDRLRVMLGDERLSRLEDARVLVFGCGGVGSSCIEALARITRKPRKVARIDADAGKLFSALAHFEAHGNGIFNAFFRCTYRRAERSSWGSISHTRGKLQVRYRTT